MTISSHENVSKVISRNITCLSVFLSFFRLVQLYKSNESKIAKTVSELYGG